MVDYRGLNGKAQHDSYTLPLSDNILQRQSLQRILTVIGLKDCHHQMPLAQESLAYTAMSIPLGDLHSTVMPMGITYSNATF